MRSAALATILLLSTSLAPAFAEEAEKTPTQSQLETAPAQGQPQTVPVQPERTPQQSEQSLAPDQKRAQDVQVGRDWRTQPRDGDMGRLSSTDMAQMMERMASMCQNMQRMMEQMHAGMRGGRMDRSTDRGYGDGQYEDRSPRRAKVCIEYENGDELCRYRD